MRCRFTRENRSCKSHMWPGIDINREQATSYFDRSINFLSLCLASADLHLNRALILVEYASIFYLGSHCPFNKPKKDIPLQNANNVKEISYQTRNYSTDKFIQFRQNSELKKYSKIQFCTISTTVFTICFRPIVLSELKF